MRLSSHPSRKARQAASHSTKAEGIVVRPFRMDDYDAAFALWRPKLISEGLRVRFSDTLPASMSDGPRSPIDSPRSADELDADPDRRAILARRDLLVAVALTGALASCGGNSSSSSKSVDAAPPTLDGSSDTESAESGNVGVDGADDGASVDAGGTGPSTPCFCVY